MLGPMAHDWEATAHGYFFRFFSPEQVDQILREGYRRGRKGSHTAIERILKLEPDLPRIALWKRIRRLKMPAASIKYHRVAWTPEDETTLRDGYQAGWPGKRRAVQELLRRHPDWRPHVIWRRAAKLGLVRQTAKRRPERHFCPWSESDDLLLLSLAGYRRLRAIAKLLHRSESGIRYRLAVLGKSSRVHVDGYARRALAEELHFGRRTLQRWIAEGLLEVRDPRITPESIQDLRRSGYLSTFAPRSPSAETVEMTGKQLNPATPAEISAPNCVGAVSAKTATRCSRALRVWAGTANELGVSVNTVKGLVAERTLRLYDPRITEKSLANFCHRNGSLINWNFLDEETRDWLHSSLGLDRNAGGVSARLNASRRHAAIMRKCECGRIIRGNAFFNHSKTCKRSKLSPKGAPDPFLSLCFSAAHSRV